MMRTTTKTKKKNSVIVVITFKNITEARRITNALLEEHLVACCNLVHPVESYFWWEGKIQKEQEVLALLKTQMSRFKRLVIYVRRMHSYQTPEIVALPIRQGNKAYLDWVREVVK